MDTLHTQNLYKDIQLRTGGEIYIGVVGPVRTGKSTFIKRFMDLLVLPYITDEAEKIRAQDELPPELRREDNYHNGAQIHTEGSGPDHAEWGCKRTGAPGGLCGLHGGRCGRTHGR